MSGFAIFFWTLWIIQAGLIVFLIVIRERRRREIARNAAAARWGK